MRLFQPWFQPLFGVVAASLVVSCIADDQRMRGGSPVDDPDAATVGEAGVEGEAAVEEVIPERTEPREQDQAHAVFLSATADQQAVLDDIEREREASASMSAEDLLDRYPAEFSTSLPYNPLDSENLDSIQWRFGTLPEASRDLLVKNGFVVRDGVRRGTFGQGYYDIFEADQPVFVSADAILEAVYRSHQSIQASIEGGVLLPAVQESLEEMREALSQGECGGFGASTCADVDEYLAVALSLVQGSLAVPVQGGDGYLVKSLVDAVTAAKGVREFLLFGTVRSEDMSQFKPRGYYTKSVELSRFFRAMMWLGRIDFRMIETLGNGSQVFRLGATQAMLAVRSLMNPSVLAGWTHIDDVLRTLVSEQDNMNLRQIDDLLHDLGDVTPESAAAMEPSALAEAIAQGGYGQQQIASSIIINHTGTRLPLSASFRLMGQRFTVDSQVFTQVTWDRTEQRRMMPSPLDAAFGAWGNHGAAYLLLPDLTTYSYAPNLHMARYVAVNHTNAFWDAGIYHGWLGALSGLNTRSQDLANPLAAGLPSVAGSEAWNRRILNTQLASWSQLRHNAVLYAKQSGSTGEGCSFSDAYVDPYPEFFERLGEYARRGLAMVEAFTPAEQQVAYSAGFHFSHLAFVASRLGAIATDQRSGLRIAPDDLVWLNGMIGIGKEYGAEEGWHGWYANLFVDVGNAERFEPTITDVHTQPTDAAGSSVGNVLHVGTGAPRFIIVTVDTGAERPRAFAGFVSSFHEHITSDFERLTDEEWKGMVGNHPLPSWLASVVGP